MNCVPLKNSMTKAVTAIIQTNPGRIFCRGVFVPCKSITTDEIENVFKSDDYDPSLSYACIKSKEVVGFITARQKEQQIQINLLEADRNNNFSEVIEMLLEQIRSCTTERKVDELKFTPFRPLASGLNLKDDNILDPLFKMGFWQNIVVASEMRINLENYNVPPKAETREAKLLEEDIIIKPCTTQQDLDALDKMCQWRNAPPSFTSWGRLVRNVIDKIGPEYVIAAIKDSKAVGYSTFFARTIMTTLPEYGPVRVQPEFRGKGIASVMLAKSLTSIKELGKAKEVQLSCYPNKFPVYPRQGFYFTHKYLFEALSKPTII